jgi:hypothetical protein
MSETVSKYTQENSTRSVDQKSYYSIQITVVDAVGPYRSLREEAAICW